MKSVLRFFLIPVLFFSATGAVAQPRPVPDWVRDGVIYEIYPRAFSQQGNFNGITARLEELKDLGVTILWLMPIHPIGQEKKKGTIGSPYAVRDYYAINPDYGTGDDLKRLVKEAHARGLKVIIDIVANHTSWDSVLMKHPEFYKRDAKGNITYPYDWYDIAALNYDNQQLRGYMIDMLKYWIREFDLDGFRCDVAGEVPTDFWERARVELEKVKPDIVMLAEAHKAELQVKAFDLDYSWPLHSALAKVLWGQAPASTLREEWEKEVKEWPKGALHMRFSDNHDERRAIARFGEPAALAASAFMFTLDGVPMIYNGMEVGDTTESGAPALFEKLPIFWAIGERRPEFRKFYKEMMARRRASWALRRGSLEWVSNSDESRVVSFVRRAEGEEVLVAINFSNKPFAGTVRGANVSLAAWESKIESTKGGDSKADLGSKSRWPTAAKNGFGTSVTLDSKVWFTLADGVMTEVFYPTIDSPKVKRLQLHVHTDAGVEQELNDTVHRLEVPYPISLTFRQMNTAKSGRYTIAKTYVTDPRRNSVLINVRFQSQIPSHLSAHYEPSLKNNGNSALLSNCGSKPRTVFECTIVLGFGENVATATSAARDSLARGFAAVRREYAAGWQGYVAGLPRIEPKYQRQFDMAAMVLRGLEDKTFRGGVIASPSVPWGGGADADEATISGYHAVWSRDLYHAATAFMALGDVATANRLLDYLFRVQQKPDGSFPRNTWVDGRVIGDGLQMDQVALPLVLAYQLKRTDRVTWQKHVKPAAELIVRRGPKTDQDRWEEKSGYFPATVAAEIAGLVCAAEIAKVNGEIESATRYLNTADEWARNLELIDPARVDAGFLELVRLGVKPARDKSIIEALAMVDKTIKVTSPAGEAWYRYNNDAYGETPSGGDFDGRNGVGRLWTLLAGERGEYEIAAGNLGAARRRLETMSRFANDGLMIPEQVWDRSDSPNPAFRFGEGTGSATPLAWSMAQFIRLALNLKHGRNLETPDVVSQRYLAKPQRGTK
ncbi:MAG TPA: alpha-amylase family glycosyl hydrolase [Pyrinomonadaceae bacterium]|nr:alpha-amylase family glycosyl hydrolase [Pyrinomonadaceae bacterium]